VSYRFGEFVLDAGARELTRGGPRIALEPSVLDLLVLLVERRARVVSRGEILDVVWQGRAVSESTVDNRVALLRRALGDTARDSRLIRTYPRRGLRFVGSVQVEGHAQQEDRPAAIRVNAPLTSLRKPVLAVMPLHCAAGSGGTEREGVVLAEEIASRAVRIPWLSVVSPSGDGRFPSATHAVECSAGPPVQGTCRVHARLVDMANRTIIWAGSAQLEHDDRGARDRFAVRVALAIEILVAKQILALVHKVPDDELDARETYLIGVECVHRWTRQSIDDALACFVRSIALDAEFAAPYGMLAYCYVQRQSNGWLGPGNAQVEACGLAARTAAELAGEDVVTLARAAHALAAVTGDIDSGFMLVESALRIDPACLLARYVCGWLHLFAGRADRAAEDLELAWAVGAASRIGFKIQAALAYVRFFQERFDEGGRLAFGVTQAHPSYQTALRAAAANLCLGGRRKEASVVLAASCRLDPAIRASVLPSVMPFQTSSYGERWCEALRLSGLPD
jgi:DNA-binding winged helix-turn-helix (wHTH) protein